MPVVDTFSYRQSLANGEMLDVFVYDELPEGLRKQIIRIWRNAIGPHIINPSRLGTRGNGEAWRIIHDTVAQEHELLNLGNDPVISKRCETYLLGASVKHALDLIEVSFEHVDKVVRDFNDHDRRRCGIKVNAAEAIGELNERFRRAGVGYRFEDGKIIRVDSELIHSEVVQPALRYLHQQGFEGPREEFMKAHAHYRAGEMKDAITNANNAFESTLKAICDRRQWKYQRGARASDLLKVIRKNGLLPSYLDTSFNQLVSTLKSGLPRVRGEEGGHGQGATPRKTPDYVAAYALHLAAANILFLAEAHEAMGGA